MRLNIVVLISVLAVGSIVIFLGFLTNQEYIEIPEISNQYENLEKYKNELEKINQHNQQILKDLEEQFKNSDDVYLDQINEEIAVIKRVVNENKEELEQVIKKLSQMDSKPWSNTNFQFWEIYIIIISYLEEVVLGMAKGVFLFLVGSIVGFITTPLFWSTF